MEPVSDLQRVMDSGKFAVTAEIGPPKHANAEVIKKHADVLKGHVEAANLTDNQTAIVRMSSIAAGALCVNYGVEPVIQMVCRDRNRIAIQSDLLGAYALGCRNLLCLSGDHQQFGNHPDSKNVFDVDSIQLLYMLKTMIKDKKFQCGDEIKSDFDMFIGAAANPFGDPFEFRVTRLKKKIEAGAQFIQTQCVFDIERFKKYMDGVVAAGLDKKVHIMAGVTPMKSDKGFKYIKKYVAGMSVPDEMIARIAAVEDKKEEGVKIAVETINEIKKIKGVHGVHIMAIGWESIVPRIIEETGLKVRPDYS
ncbi:methylenetetrahydrofolate reductase [Thermodesulfobacteriota bacterium]